MKTTVLQDSRAVPQIDSALSRSVEVSVLAFERWLDSYGETSYDFQTFYASRYGRFAKALYYRNRRLGACAVAPMVLCEAFVPAARRFFSIPQRFPIADAHYAMGFARLFRHTGDRRYLNRAVHFLEALLDTACHSQSGLGWGYPFDWVTIDGTIPRQTPLITTLPYVYEAFAAVQEIEPHDRWLETMHSIAEHALHDYRDYDAGSWLSHMHILDLAVGSRSRGQCKRVSCFPAHEGSMRLWQRQVSASRRTEPAVRSEFTVARRLMALRHRRPAGFRRPLPHLLRAEGAGQDRAAHGTWRIRPAIERGLDYYTKHLFDSEGLPRPFAKPPRLIVYRKELYDYAECINLLTLVVGTATALDCATDGRRHGRHWARGKGLTARSGVECF